ncbi:unnamed protein product [Ectocarpus sp. 6 AP-2014]
MGMIRFDWFKFFDIAEALSPLVDFAKDILKDYEEDWERFPIYLKATAGVRQLPYGDREALLSAVRDFLGNPETCPFYFQFDHARVISGEERLRAFLQEGIYGWAAVNFLRGELLALSEGVGTAVSSGNMTVGTLDLGGASTQISFFKSDQDILANLFKLQIGAEKHWNVYTHSFLQFGLNSARARMHTKVVHAVAAAAAAAPAAADADADEGVNAPPLEVVDACLPKGFNESFVSPEDGKEYLIVPADGGADFDACDRQTAELLEASTSSGSFCQFAFPGQCSVLGVYQPELPQGGEHGRFYGFSGYYKLWQFLDLDESTTVAEIVDEGKRVCGMSREDLSAYNSVRKGHEHNVPYLAKYCFMSSYVTTLLSDGYRFPVEEHIHFVDEVGGYKVDWSLGSMLYEINALPWSYVTPADPAAAAQTSAAAAQEGRPSAAREGRCTTFVWASVAAAFAAVAAIVYGFLERTGRLNSIHHRAGGAPPPYLAARAGTREEASPWRMTGAVGAGGVIGTGRDRGRRTSGGSQYESISDVSSSRA